MQPDQTTVTARDLQFDLHEALVSGMTYTESAYDFGRNF